MKNKKMALIATAALSLLIGGDNKKEDFSLLNEAIKKEYYLSEIKHKPELENVCTNKKPPKIEQIPYNIIKEYEKRGDVLIVAITSNTHSQIISYIVGRPLKKYEEYKNVIVYEQIAPTFDEYCGGRYTNTLGYSVEDKKFVNATAIESFVNYIFEKGRNIKTAQTLEDKLITRIINEYKTPQQFKEITIKSIIYHELGHTKERSVNSEINAYLSELINSPNYGTLYRIMIHRKTDEEIISTAAIHVLNSIYREVKIKKELYSIEDLVNIDIKEIQEAAKRCVK
ncbi:MAG: hypothetical protein QXG86_03530 [Candidatus Woesearchaeota archaeon]